MKPTALVNVWFALALFIAGLLWVPGRLAAGPPLLTDDPDIPGDDKLEINLATALDKRGSDWELETPMMDINYGWGERVQLKYEVPGIFQDKAGSDKYGLGNPKTGMKWRFLDEDRHSIALSVYPQFEFNNPGSSSADRGLMDRGSEYLLPLQMAHSIGPAWTYLEAGACLAGEPVRPGVLRAGGGIPARGPVQVDGRVVRRGRPTLR
ncbi:MAG: hypothetical protein VCA36_13310 [Opitutales bacterium]